jgi:hypothetical protein
MTKGANQGAYAEGKVRDFLKGWAETHAGFCFNRILDAKSSMGAMSNPQPGDFQWFLNTNTRVHLRRRATVDEASAMVLPRTMAANGLPPREVWVNDEPVYTRNGLIEVKHVKHTHRLPHGNFGADQVGRMVIRQMAGSEPLVLICFRPEGEKPQWCAPPFEMFQTREGGSWNMLGQSMFPSPAAILESYLS